MGGGARSKKGGASSSPKPHSWPHSLGLAPGRSHSPVRCYTLTRTAARQDPRKKKKSKCFTAWGIGDGGEREKKKQLPIKKEGRKGSSG